MHIHDITLDMLLGTKQIKSTDFIKAPFVLGGLNKDDDKTRTDYIHDFELYTGLPHIGMMYVTSMLLSKHDKEMCSVAINGKTPVIRPHMDFSSTTNLYSTLAMLIMTLNGDGTQHKRYSFINRSDGKGGPLIVRAIADLTRFIISNPNGGFVSISAIACIRAHDIEFIDMGGDVFVISTEKGRIVVPIHGASNNDRPKQAT